MCTHKTYDVSLLTADGDELVIRTCGIVILGFAIRLDECLGREIDNVPEASVQRHGE